MISLLILQEVSVPVDSSFEIHHQVGARVLCKIEFNNPGHHAPGDKLSGTVVSVFGSPSIFRVRLDARWNGTVPGYGTKRIVVGNVTARSLSPL